MCVVAVRIERGAIFIELVRIDLAVMVGERQHLVAGEFDGSSWHLRRVLLLYARQ